MKGRAGETMIPKGRRSFQVSLVATLAAIHIVLSYLPPPVGFRRMSIVMEPLEGAIAGPYLGFAAATVGWVGGRFLRPDGIWIENFFGIAEPIGALGAGFLASKRWYLTGIIYGTQLLAFLLNPLARHIPLWTLWDTYLGFLAIFAAAYLLRRLERSRFSSGRLIPPVALIAFVAVELDVMVRVFMLIVGGIYQLYPIPTETLPTLFVAGAILTPIEAGYSVVVATIVGVPVLLALQRGKILQWPPS